MKNKLAAVFLVSLLCLAWGGYNFRRFDFTALLELPPCFMVGGPLHHYFQPNCRGRSTSYGVDYEINEMGYRERAPGTFSSPVIFLGDSVIEGWRLHREETLSFLLEKKMGGPQFFNAGIRFTGPVIQSLRLQQLVELKPRAVVWFLSENDVGDDRLAYSLSKQADSKGVPEILGTEDFDAVAGWARWVSRENPLWRPLHLAIYWRYHWGVKRLQARADERGYGVCGGLNRGIALLKEKSVPLYFASIPLGPYNPDKKMETDFEQLRACAGDHPFLDLREELRDRKEFYFERDTHLNPSGSRLVADRLAAYLSPLMGVKSFPR